MSHRHLILAVVLLAASAPQPARADIVDARARYAAILKEEARKAGLPYEIADAVTAVESGYDPDKIGGVGEIGLMQVRPTTAAMLGFRGSLADLAKPEINIHLGVAYLVEAWRQADGDLCRTLMKYRAGHGQKAMSPLSVAYCLRARAHLAAIGSELARGAVPVATIASPSARRPQAIPAARLSDAAFWAAHEARIRAISARIERRWRRMAAR